MRKKKMKERERERDQVKSSDRGGRRPAQVDNSREQLKWKRFSCVKDVMSQLCYEARRKSRWFKLLQNTAVNFQYASPVFWHDGDCHMGTSVSASNVEVT